jgi:hypothetical protein
MNESSNLIGSSIEKLQNIIALAEKIENPDSRRALFLRIEKIALFLVSRVRKNLINIPQDLANVEADAYLEIFYNTPIDLQLPPPSFMRRNNSVISDGHYGMRNK